MRRKAEGLRGELVRIQEERDGYHNQKHRLLQQRQHITGEVLYFVSYYLFHNAFRDGYEVTHIFA